MGETCRAIKHQRLSLAEIMDVPGVVTGWFSQLSSQSASGSDSVGTLPV